MATADTRANYSNRHALAVGINDYEFESPLGYAVNDAELVGKGLP